MDIVALFQCLQPSLPSRTWRQLSRIAVALLVMTGRVTMLGLSRWTGKGGSYRTVQRLFSTVMPWAILFWVCFRHHVYCPDEVYLAAGDEVIVTKAGTCTHGLDRFFASLYGKPVPGLAFFTVSLVSVQQRRAFPMRVEQVVRVVYPSLADNISGALLSRLQGVTQLVISQYIGFSRPQSALFACA